MRQRASILALIVVGTWVPCQGCAIDFDAPFSESSADASVPVGGSGGVPDAGDSGGASGDAGAATGGTGGSAGAATGGTGGTGGTAMGGTGGTSTGGTGGTSTGGTGGTSTGGTGGTQVPTKNCSNGIDDDDDGLTDCEDPDCQDAGYACVPPPPSNWTGLFDLRMDWLAPPTCNGLWENEFATGGTDIAVPTASCQSCSCATSTNAQCGMSVTVYDQPSCAGNTQTSVFVSDGQCVNVGMQAFGPRSVRPTSVMQVVSGSCSPQSSGSASIPPVTWADHARACSPTAVGDGCTASTICAPPTATGLVCVARTGQHSCPTAYSEVKKTVFQSLDDGRSCTACACGYPTGSCSGASISVEDPSDGCQGPGAMLAPNQCEEISVHPTYGTFSLESWYPGGLNATCTASGGALTGTVTLGSPITVCCRAH